MDPFFPDTLADAALDRMRIAVEYADAGSPFQNLFIPATRQRQIPAGTMSSAFCYAAGEAGQGISRQIPQFRITDRLNIDGFVAQGAEATTDLDQVVGKLARAILELLLQDTTFLELFGWVITANWSKQDVSTGKEAKEFDTIEFRIEIEIGGGVTTYAPVTPADATYFHTAALTLTLDEQNAVEADFQLQQ